MDISSNMPTKDGRVNAKEKISFALPGFTASISSQAAAFYILFFFINVADIPSNIAWVVLLCCSFFDVLSDAAAGFYLRNKKANSRYFRSYILFTALPLAVFSVLLFTTPQLPLNAKITYYVLIYAVWNSVLALFSISSLSILPAITQDNSERAKLNSLRITVSIITVIMVSSATMPLVNFFGSSDLAKGFLYTMIIFASLGLAVQLVAYKNLKVRNNVLISKEHISVKKSLVIIFKDKYIIIIMLMHFFCSTANAFKNQSTLYYVSHVLNRPDLISVFFFITISFSLLMQFFIPKIIKKIPLEIASLIGVLGSIFSLLFIYLAGTNIIMFIFAACLFGIFSALPANIIYLMLAKNIDSYYKKHNVNLSGTVYSLMSSLSKIGAGIGLTVSAVVLNLVGYSAAQGASQTPLAIFGITFNYIFASVAGFLLAFIFILLYVIISRKKPENQK